MIIDERKKTVSINIENIDSFEENADTERLTLIYSIPDAEGNL